MDSNGYKNRHGRHGRHGRHVHVNANTINMTNNVTNVTNVTQIAQVSGNGWNKKRLRSGNGYCGKRERKPRLLRFCASGGLLDQDVAERMSGREMCDGFVEVGSYAAKGLGRTMGKLADDMGRHAKSFSNNLLGILECLFG